MVVRLSNGRVGVEKHAPAFLIGANAIGPFQFGIKVGTDFWLQGLILDGPEFIFNGRLFLPDGGLPIVIDKTPKSPIPAGWTLRIRSGIDYELSDSTGMTLFSYVVSDKECKLTLNLYDSSGRLVVETFPNELRIYTDLFYAGSDAVKHAP